MMDFTAIMKEMPALGMMAFFVWALLRIVTQVLQHYQKMLDGVLMVILREVQRLRERTREDDDLEPAPASVHGAMRRRGD
jgi:hypothetical protein